MTREGHKERRQWLPSLPKKIRQLRRQRRRKRFDSTKAVESAKGCKTFDTEYELSLFSMIPESIWTDKILPFLDRWSQNHLMETCRYISQQTFFDNEEQLKLLKWPTPGRICVSRQVLSLAFSPTDQHLFAAMAGRNQCLEYDKRFGPQNELLPEADAYINVHHQGFQKGRRRPKAGNVVAVQFSPDGTMLATASRSNGNIRLHHVSSAEEHFYEPFRILHSYQDALRYILWSPDSRRIASWGDDGFIRVLNTENGLMQSIFWKTRIEVSACSETVAFHPHNSSTLAFAHNNDMVRLWNFERDQVRVLGESRDATRSYDGSFVTSVAYSPDGKYLAIGHPVSMIRLWTVTVPGRDEDNDENDDDDDNGFFFHDYSKRIFMGSGWSAVRLITFTSDSNYIACTGDGKQIRIANVSTGMVVQTLNGHTARVQALCFSSDNQTLASAGFDRSIRLWDMQGICTV